MRVRSVFEGEREQAPNLLLVCLLSSASFLLCLLACFVSRRCWVERCKRVVNALFSTRLYVASTRSCFFSLFFPSSHTCALPFFSPFPLTANSNPPCNSPSLLLLCHQKSWNRCELMLCVGAVVVSGNVCVCLYVCVYGCSCAGVLSSLLLPFCFHCFTPDSSDSFCPPPRPVSHPRLPRGLKMLLQTAIMSCC